MSKKHLVMVFGLAFAIGFAGSHVSCSDTCEATLGKGDPCEQDCECKPPLTCNKTTKKCSDPPVQVTCADTGQPGCTTNTQCGSGNVCRFNCCLKLCSSNADCDASKKEQCDTGAGVPLCVKATCSATSDCGDEGQVCDSGSCVTKPAPAAAASCMILPAGGVAVAGSTKQFYAIAKDASGKVLVVPPSYFTWGPTSGAVTVDANGLATVSSGVAEDSKGTVNITAQVTDGVACSPASLTYFGPVSAGKMRVVAVDGKGMPLPGATVALLEGSTNTIKGTTDADGMASFALAGSNPETVTVAKDGYAWVTVYKTTSRNLLVSAPKHGASKFGFKGTASKADFLRLEEEGGLINFALFGAAIPGNALDINLDTIVGELVDTRIEISASQVFEASLPSGAVIGLGGDFFKGSGVDRVTKQPDPKKGFWFFSDPGVSAAWGIGGNVGLDKIGPLIQQVQGGGEVEVGRILSALLPILAGLQAGAKGAVTPGEMTNSDTLAGLADIKVDLTQRLRLKQIVNIPELPDSATDPGKQWAEGVIILGGVNAPGRGIVPTGLTAGLDVIGTNEAPNGIVWGDEHDGKVPLRLAPANGGIEGGGYVNLALAVSLSGASLSGGSSSSSSALKLSGLVHQRNCAGLPSGTECVKFDLADPPVVNFANGGFLGFPLGSARSGRVLNLAGVDGKADVVRFDVRGDDGDWYVYADSNQAVIEVPPAPDGMSDRFNTAGADYLIQSLAVSGSAPDVVTFNSYNMDSLNEHLEAFSTFEVP